jgi:quercetin dioxygenase-like cupin family protein
MGKMKSKSTKSLIGRPVDLGALIDYQGKSVVSREILRKDTGTITVFAFAEGQGLSEHSAPFDAFVQILDGEAEVRISGRPHKVSMGESIIMPANRPHSLQAVKRFKMLLTMIRK